MTIQYPPNQGEILICNFSGSVEPEICKKRPVIVLTPRFRRIQRLLTVIPLSTTAPTSIQRWHLKLHLDLPAPYESPECWAKCDLIQTVSWDRLSLFRAGKDCYGKRIYPRIELDNNAMEKVWDCVLHGIGGSSSKALFNFALRELLSITQARFLCKRLFRVLLKSFQEEATLLD